MKLKYFGFGAGLALAAMVAIATPALAERQDGRMGPPPMGERMDDRREGWNGNNGTSTTMMRPVVVGDVSAISGTNLTVVVRGMGRNVATSTFSVDASTAVVIKGDATSTISSISVGDNVVVLGTISGTSVKAAVIRDGKIRMMGDDRDEKDGRWASSTNATSTHGELERSQRPNFFRNIGGFFRHLFGF